MRKKGWIAMMAAGLVGLMACQKEESAALAERTEGAAVEWNIVWENTGNSRISLDEAGNGRFTEGDSLSVLAFAGTGMRKVSRLWLEQNRWNSPLTWEDLQAETVRFTAFYPAASGKMSRESWMHTVPSDQAPKDSLEAADLLWATAEAGYKERVDLHFSHAMSRLRIVISEGDGYSEQELNEMRLTVRGVRSVQVNPGNGEWTVAAQAPESIVPYRMNSRTFYVILPAQPVDPIRSGCIRIELGGRSSLLSLPEEIDGRPFRTLEQGKETALRLRIQKKEESWAGRKLWFDGITAPEESRWTGENRERLPWWEGCGWYDCNKIQPKLGGTDSRLCWAASASNLIHWWMDNRARQIREWGHYTGPSEIPSMTESSVFRLFKESFPNQGNDVLKGLNWFFNGVFSKNVYDTDTPDPRAGFFRALLGTRSLGTYDMLVTKERFQILVKDALLHHKAVGVAFNLSGYGDHAVNIWGAEFDEAGEINAIYMVDNNDGPPWQGKGMLYRKEVRYQPMNEQPTLYPYISNSAGTFTYRLIGLYTLSLGDDALWKQ